MSNFFAKIFWIRVWMPISIAAAFAVWKFPKATALAQGNEWPILFAQLFLLGICFAITASGAFEPENPSELLSDTKGDVFWVIVTSNTLTYLYVDNGFTIYWLPITMLALSAGVAILDLWISLRGGTAKLQELDKGRVSIGR